MNKNKAIGLLENARDNSRDMLTRVQSELEDEDTISLIEIYNKEIELIEEYLDNPKSMAFELLKAVTE